MTRLLLTLTIAMAGLWAQAEDVKYKVTFKGHFSETTHPRDNFPGNPHFSPVNFAVHTSEYNLFNKFSFSTPGMKNVAETGNPRDMQAELQQVANLGVIKEFGRTSPFDGLEEVSFELTATKTHYHISMVSMIAPSPDWIVGINKLSLKANGYFIDKLEVPLFALDAGTDSGEDYTSRNKQTVPAQPITKLESVLGVPSVIPYAIVTIEKM